MPLVRFDEIDISMLEALHQNGIKIKLSPLRSKHEIVSTGEKYYHVINHGLTLKDIQQNQHPDISQSLRSLVSGWVFRCGFNDDPSKFIEAIGQFDDQYNLKSTMHLRMAGDNPADLVGGDSEVCRRLASAIFSAKAVDGPQIFCDGLIDNDRGYFPRYGVLDRLYNPKSGFHLIKNMHAIFSDLDGNIHSETHIATSSGCEVTTRETVVTLHLNPTSELASKALGISLLEPRAVWSADLEFAGPAITIQPTTFNN